MFSPVVDKTTLHAVRREYDIFFFGWLSSQHTRYRRTNLGAWKTNASQYFVFCYPPLAICRLVYYKARSSTYLQFCVCMYILNCSRKHNNQDFPWLFFFWLTIWGFAPNLISWKHMRKLSYVTAPPLFLVTQSLIMHLFICPHSRANYQNSRCVCLCLCFPWCDCFVLPLALGGNLRNNPAYISSFLRAAPVGLQVISTVPSGGRQRGPPLPDVINIDLVILFLLQS